MNTQTAKSLSSKLLASQRHRCRRCIIKATAATTIQGNTQPSSSEGARSITSQASLQNHNHSYRPYGSALSDKEFEELRERYFHYLESDENAHHRTSMAYSMSLASPEPVLPFISDSMVAQLEHSTDQLVRNKPSKDGDDAEVKERCLNHLESDENAVYSLSLASLESDFTSSHIAPLLNNLMKAQLEHSTNQLVGNKPSKDHDIAELKERCLDHLESDENAAYSLSLAPPESDFTSSDIAPLLTDLTKAQLEYSTNQLVRYETQEEPQNEDVTNKKYQQRALPRSYTQAIQNTSDAIVITCKSHPFRIVAVNDAWTNLCGYTQTECYGKTLQSLLHGPKTNATGMQDTMSTLTDKHEDGETTLINYAKNGREFVNKVKIGPLQDDVTGEVTHFVGLLSEIMQGDSMFVEKE